MKLTREEVYAVITEEGEYAKKYDIGESKFPEHHADKDKNLETWIFWMEAYIRQAKNVATVGYNKEAALHCLRSALSVGVNAAMYHGLPHRPQPFLRGSTVGGEK